jgi:hypothetical protein
MNLNVFHLTLQKGVWTCCSLRYYTKVLVHHDRVCILKVEHGVGFSATKSTMNNSSADIADMEL